MCYAASTITLGVTDRVVFTLKQPKPASIIHKMIACASAQIRLREKIAEKHPDWDIESDDDLSTTFRVNLAGGFKISVSVPMDMNDLRPKVIDVALFHNWARVENQFGYDDNNKLFSGEVDVFEPSVVGALCCEIRRVQDLVAAAAPAAAPAPAAVPAPVGSSWASTKKARRRACWNCRKRKKVKWLYDPYDREINNKFTWGWYCYTCYNNSGDDV